jgi:hypothetical protein
MPKVNIRFPKPTFWGGDPLDMLPLSKETACWADAIFEKECDAFIKSIYVTEPRYML